MTTSTPHASGAAGFHADRPAHLRDPSPWHPLRHVVRRLSRLVARLSRHLELSPDARVLDYGCADMPYRHLFGPPTEYVGADLPGNPAAAVEISRQGALPSEGDETFDAVLSTQVLEHVSDPALYLSECYRVLKRGGRLLLTTHGIMIYHPDPVDYWRWTWAGLRRATADAGFEIVRFEGMMGLASTGLQLVQDGIYHRMRRRALKHAFAWTMQRLIALADRLESNGGAAHNALVFGLVARKP